MSVCIDIHQIILFLKYSVPCVIPGFPLNFTINFNLGLIHVFFLVMLMQWKATNSSILLRVASNSHAMSNFLKTFILTSHLCNHLYHKKFHPYFHQFLYPSPPLFLQLLSLHLHNCKLQHFLNLHFLCQLSSLHLLHHQIQLLQHLLPLILQYLLHLPLQLLLFPQHIPMLLGPKLVTFNPKICLIYFIRPFPPLQHATLKLSGMLNGGRLCHPSFKHCNNKAHWL